MTRTLSWGLAALVAVSSLARAQDGSTTSPVLVQALRAWQPVPEEENAALILKDVAKRLLAKAKAPAAPRLPEELRSAEDSDPRVVDHLRKLVAFNRGELDRLDLITEGSKFDWGDPPASPVVLAPIDLEREVGSTRATGLLCWDAQLARVDGDLDRMLRRAEQVDAIARGESLALSGWQRTGYLPGCRAAILAAVASSVDFNAYATTPAGRERLNRLLVQLQDDRIERQSVRDWANREAIVARDTAAAVRAKRVKPGHSTGINFDTISGYLVEQNFSADAIEGFAEVMDEIARLIGDDEPFTRAHYRKAMDARIIQPLQKKPVLMMTLGQSALPRVSEQVAQSFNTLARQHAVTVALAARLYALDHSGQLPPSLIDLVPDYLQSELRDNTAPDGSAVRYESGSNARVWTTLDGKDDGGNDPPPSLIGRNSRLKDFVIPLPKPSREILTPATTPVR
ncbi:MAG: hypothetical protein QM770_20060 [Tepidisphaeraceae bacterium]